MVTIERREGVVRTVRDGKVTVRIQQQSACAGCHAKEFCCSTDCADRDILIETTEPFEPGEVVVIEGRDHIGRLAVLLSFVLPIILLLLGLVCGIRLWGLSEVQAILLAFGLLALYYAGLYLLDPRLGQIMKFEITKADIS